LKNREAAPEKARPLYEIVKKYGMVSGRFKLFYKNQLPIAKHAQLTALRYALFL
jgi:hypothetical protein